MAFDSKWATRAFVEIRARLAHWAPVPLRLIVGYGFMAHGYAKLANGPERFIAILHALGVPSPSVMGWATIAVELVGGLAVLLGAFVPIMTAPMTAVMIVASISVHLPYGFSSIKLRGVTADGPQFGPPGYETALLYIACMAALVLGGSGPFSIDTMLTRRSSRKTGDLTSSGPSTVFGHRSGEARKRTGSRGSQFRFGYFTTLYEETVAFYRDGLGLPVLESWNREHDDRGTLFTAGAGIIEVLFLPSGPASSHLWDDRPPQGVFMAMEAAELERVYQLAVDRRLPIQQTLTTQPWGHRSFCLKEPNGLTLYVFRQE